MYDGIMLAHEENKKVVEWINSIKAEIGKPKFEFPSLEPDHDMFEAIKEFCIDDIKIRYGY